MGFIKPVEHDYTRVISVEREQVLWQNRADVETKWRRVSEAKREYEEATRNWSGPEQKPDQLSLECGMIVRVMPARWRWPNKNCQYGVLKLTQYGSLKGKGTCYEGPWQNRKDTGGDWHAEIMRLNQSTGAELRGLGLGWHVQIVEAWGPTHPLVAKLARKHRAWRVAKRIGVGGDK